jgi:serine/threonine-protein kinase mTOR
VALRTLGRLVASTGCVVDPYLRYPELMPRILGLLQEGGNMPWTLKQEVLRTLGLLGALDPYKLETVNSSSDPNPAAGLVIMEHTAGGGGVSGEGSHHSGAGAGGSSMSFSAGRRGGVSNSSVRSTGAAQVKKRYNTEDMPAAGVMFEQSAMLAMPSLKQELERLTPNLEDYYPKVAIKSLMKVLRDPSLSAHYQMVTQAVIHVFQNLGHLSIPIALRDVLPLFLVAIRSGEAGQREALLLQLAAITRIVKSQMIKFLEEVFDLVRVYWSVHTEQV